MESITIRAYQPEDLPHVEALEARIKPYRPEDETAVKAMYARAEQAYQANDPRWMGFPVYVQHTIAQEFDAFWVAERSADPSPAIVGIVAVQALRPGEAIPARHPLVQDWQKRGRVAELRRLRVAPEARGQNLGTRLCQTVLDWSRERFDLLVVNTTTPQEPALRLYCKLGFKEVGVSFIDRYELLWMELVR